MNVTTPARLERATRFARLIAGGFTVLVHPETFGEIIDDVHAAGHTVHGLPVIVDETIPRATVAGAEADRAQAMLAGYQLAAARVRA